MTPWAMIRKAAETAERAMFMSEQLGSYRVTGEVPTGLEAGA